MRQWAKQKIRGVQSFFEMLRRGFRCSVCGTFPEVIGEPMCIECETRAMRGAD